MGALVCTGVSQVNFSKCEQATVLLLFDVWPQLTAMAIFACQVSFTGVRYVGACTSADARMCYATDYQHACNLKHYERVPLKCTHRQLTLPALMPMFGSYQRCCCGCLRMLWLIPYLGVQISTWRGCQLRTSKPTMTPQPA